MRPILEYASTVWDNCTCYDKDKLEILQIETAGLVTGTTRSISLQKLYKEIGWLTLADRRKYQNLIIMFKVINDMVPNYLNCLFPRTVGDSMLYNLRNSDDFVTLPRRTTLFENSFVLSAVSESI